MANHGPSAREYGPTTAVGAYVAEHVKAKYRTQATAAKAWGVSQTFVSNLIRGRLYPPKWVLMAINMDEGKVLAPFCRCKPGSCERSARECVDWIKRATACK